MRSCDRGIDFTHLAERGISSSCQSVRRSRVAVTFPILALLCHHSGCRFAKTATCEVQRCPSCEVLVFVSPTARSI